MSVERFWCHEASNIRCVRESDYDALAQQLAAEKVKNQTLMIELQDKNGALVDLREQLVASQAILSRLNEVKP